MSDYLKISFWRYFISLLTGKALHLPSCLVISGWREDFIYSVDNDGQRRVEYVPSRFARLVSNIRRLVIVSVQTVTRIVDVVATILASRTVLGYLLRWGLRALAATVLGD